MLKNSCLGVYSGIFALYLQPSSDESRTRTANVVYYILCLLYLLCAVAVVCDLLVYTFGVSNKFICKNIIFIISCAVPYYLSTNRTTITSTPNLQAMVFHRITVARQTVDACCDFTAQCIIVRINHSSCTPIICFIHLNLQRSTVVGSCGAKMFVLLLFLHSWQSLS